MSNAQKHTQNEFERVRVCSNFDMDLLNTWPCIWPDSLHSYRMWLFFFYMPVVFTLCELLVYGITVRVHKLRRRRSCKRKGSCVRKVCCCCPSTTYGLSQFRHRLVEVSDIFVGNWVLDYLDSNSVDRKLGLHVVAEKIHSSSHLTRFPLVVCCCFAF